MRNMKEKLIKVSDKIIEGVGEMSIKTCEKSRGKCGLYWGFYEPKFPIELLNEEIKE